MQIPKPTSLFAITLLFALGVIWGSGYVIAKYCVMHGVPALGYSFWQSLGPAVVLTVITLLKRDSHFHCSWRYWRYYLMCGILGIAFPNTLMYFAARHLPAGILAVLVNTVPIITFPLALIFQQERFHWQRMLAVVLGVIGIMLIVIPDVAWRNNAHWFWILLVLFTPLSFALCTVFIAAFRPVPSDSLSLSAGMLVVSAILLAPITFGLGKFHALTHFTLPNSLIVLEIVLSSIGYLLFFMLIKRAGPVYYSLVGGVVTITGLFWGWLIFHEIFSVRIVIAVFAILAAIGWLSFKLKRNSQ